MDFTAIQPFSAIIGALITAAVSFLIAFSLVAKRRRLAFEIGETEELTRALRDQAHVQAKTIVISVDDQPFVSLNRAPIKVWNAGNTALEKFSFEIKIPGKHSNRWIGIAAPSLEFDQSISRTWSDHGDGDDPTAKLEVGSFLNPRESVGVWLFFDGDPVPCKVHCRIPDTKIRIRNVEFRDLESLGWADKLVLKLLIRLRGGLA